MAEGLNTPRSAEEEGDPGSMNGQLPNGDGENMMEVNEQQQQNVASGNGNPSNNSDGPGSDAESNTQEERKLTQTDHINKSLLTSFLNRLNDPTTSSQFPVTQSLDGDFDEEEAVIH